MLVLVGGGMILILGILSYASQNYNLDGFRDKTVGHGQHGTARWATKPEIRKTFQHIPFTPVKWRQQARRGEQPTANGRPLPQGIVLGCTGEGSTTALVDADDVHVLMIGASGVGKTAFFLYPNLEYACASGIRFLALDTKGDLARNYGAIARDIYGYQISVIDLREPVKSDGNNLLTLINRYMDQYRRDPENIGAKAKAEKYAKILAKTIVNLGVQAGAGIAGIWKDSGEESIPGADDLASSGSQGKMAGRFCADGSRPGHGLCYVHSAVPAECLSGLGTGAGVVF